MIEIVFSVIVLIAISLSALIIVTYHQRLKKVKPSTYVKYNVKKDKLIYDIMRTMMSVSRANRVFLFQYHNGATLASGIHFMKVTNTHELVDTYTKSTKKEFREIPLSFLNYFNDLIAVKSTVKIEDADELKSRDYSVYSMLKKHGVKSSYIFGLYDLKDNPVGFVGVDYTDKYVISDYQLDKLRIKSYQIASILN